MKSNGSLIVIEVCFKNLSINFFIIIEKYILLLLLLLFLLLLSLLLLLQVKPEITIYNYISHKKVDIRQRNKMMAEKGNF